jgi:hypothetical protein
MTLSRPLRNFRIGFTEPLSLKVRARDWEKPPENGGIRDIRKAVPTMTENKRTHKLGNVLSGTERPLLSLCPGGQTELL